MVLIATGQVGDDGRGRWRAVFPTEADETDEQALGDEGTRRRLGRLALDADPAEKLVHRKLYTGRLVNVRVACPNQEHTCLGRGHRCESPVSAKNTGR